MSYNTIVVRVQLVALAIGDLS